MDFVKEPSREIQVMRKVDVVVVGGGPGGFGAAVAAARNGAETLLVERYGFLGGMLTGGLVSWIPIDKLVPLEAYGETRAIQGGVVEEFTQKLVDIGGAIAPSATSFAKVGSVLTFPTDTEINKIVLIEMLEEAGAEILLHTLVVGVVKDGKQVKGVITESKSGRQAILADIVVDASGDADVAAFAGAEYEKDDKPLMMTLVGFLGNVDPEKAIEYSRKSNRGKFNELVDEAVKRGELTVSEKQVLPERPPSKLSPLGVLDPGKIPAGWYRVGEAGGELGSAFGDCTNVLDLTKAELAARRGLLPILSFFRKYVPGYEKAYLSYTAAQIGVRESRRVLGDYVLTADKDIEEGLVHEDVITKSRLLPIKGWSAYTPERTPAFDVPYRCIVPKVIDNILVAGRCISIDHKAAVMGAPRDIATCICLGQAAGTAAALSVRSKVRPRELPIADLQRTLKMQGANLG